MLKIKNDFKKILSLLLCLLMLFLVIPISEIQAGEGANQAEEGANITMMRTNYRENPLGIDDLTPELSWALDSGIRGEMQESYRIVVATDSQMREIVWDSGVVESTSTNVVYPDTATALEYKTKYYWQVTSNTTKSGETVSDIATFETALGGDFGADNKWIYRDESVDNFIDLTSGSVEFDVTVTGDYFDINVFNSKTESYADGKAYTLYWRIDIANQRVRIYMSHNYNVAVNYNFSSYEDIGTIEKGDTCTLKIDFSNGGYITYFNGVQLNSSYYTQLKSSICNPDNTVGNISVRTTTNGTLNNYKVLDTSGNVIAGEGAAKKPEYTLGESFFDITEGSVEFETTVTGDYFDINVFNSKTESYADGKAYTLYWRIDIANQRVRIYMSHNYNVAVNYNFSSYENIGTIKKGDTCTLKIDFSNGGYITYFNGVKLNSSYYTQLKSSICNPDNTLGKISVRTPSNGTIDAYTVLDADGIVLEEAPVYYTEPTKYASVYFRKQFTLEQDLSKVTSARLYSTAAGNQIMYMNGKRSSDDYLAPGKSQYTTTVYYQTYDVKDQLLDGDNTVAAEVGQGWYNGGPIGCRYGESPLSKGRVGLKAKLIITYSDGTEQVIDTDNTWNATNRGPVTTNRFYIGQHVDARKEIKGWNMNDSTSGKWAGVVASDTYGTSDGNMGTLTAEIMEPVKAYETFNPTSVTNPEGNKYIYKLDQNIAGTARITATAPRGTKIVVKYAEWLKEGQVDWFVDGVCMGRNGTDEYIFKGDPNGETVEFDLVYHGFQYIQIEGLDEVLPFENIECLALSNDLEKTYTFDSSSEILNQYIQNFYYTLRGNFVSSLTDCPTREKNTWTGDAQLVSAAASYFFNTYNSYLNFEEMISVSHSGDGAITETVPEQRKPASTTVASTSIIPPSGWADAVVVIPWEMYNQYGDTDIIKEYYDDMKLWISFVHNKRTYFADTPNSTGFDLPYYLDPDETNYVRIDGVYGDHLSYYRGTANRGYWEERTSNKALHNYFDTSFCEVGTAYTAYSCKLLSKMAEAIGQTEDAEYYDTLYKNYANAWRKYFVDEDGYTSLSDGETTVTIDEDGNKTYSYNPNVVRKYNGVEYDNLGSQTSYALGLYFDLYLNEDGTIDTEAKSKAAENLVKILERDEYCMKTGILGVRNIYDALSDNGQFEAALKLLENENYPSLFNMVVNGATTLWENYAGTMSQNHYAYGSGAYWVFSDILGITHGYEEENKAYKHFNLNPNYSKAESTKVNYAKGSYTSMNGTIYSEWSISKDKNTFTYNCTVPANTSATLALPIGTVGDGVRVAITEGGFDVASVEGVEFVKSEDGKYYYELTSGSYEFVVTYNVSEHTCTAGEKYYSDGEGNHYNKCTYERCPEKLNLTACSGGVATCTKKAICSICNREYGELLPHEYIEKVDNEYLVSAATFDNNAIYYKSCKHCGSTSTETFEAYKKKWLNVNITNTATTNSEDRIGIKSTSNLEAGVEYTVSFDFESNKWAIGSNPLNRVNLYIGGSKAAANLSNGTWNFNTVISNDANNSGSGNNHIYKFTLTEEQAAYGNHIIWFNIPCSASSEFYVRFSDLKLYKSSDESQTNLLAGALEDTDLSNWLYTYGKMSGTSFTSGRITSVKIIGIESEKPKMLHINMTNTAASSDYIGQIVTGTLKANTEYTVSFNMASDMRFDYYFFIGGGSKDCNNLYSAITRIRSSGSTDDNKLTNSSGKDKRYKYTFTLTDEEVAKYAKWGIYMHIGNNRVADYNIYITDFTLYESSDEKKTNLLPAGDDATKMDNWHWTYGAMSGASFTYARYTNVQYEEYESSLFETALSVSMTYPVLNKDDRLGQKINVPLEAGVEYVIEYDFQSDNISHSSNINFVFAGAPEGTENLWGITSLRATNLTGQTKLQNVDKGKGYRYKFTLTESEISDYDEYFVLFFIYKSEIGDADFTIYDFSLYRSDDENRTNLLSNDNYSSTLDNSWYHTYGKLSGTEWINGRFNSVKYVSYGGGDANADGEFDIRDLVMVDELIRKQGKSARNPMADFVRDDVLNEVDQKNCHQKLLKLK